MKGKDNQNKDEIRVMLEVAVMAAYESAMRGIDEKIHAAVNLGVTIGAAAGAEIGAKAAIAAVEKEKERYRKETYNFYYHNTEWLIKNYRTIKDHVDKSVAELKQVEEYDADFYEIMEMMRGKNYNCNSRAESIISSVSQTKILITQVDKMLEVYKKMCRNSKKAEEKRRFRVINLFYIEEQKMTAAEIAERENVDIRTIFRDIKAAFEDLTILIFGANGIRK